MQETKRIRQNGIYILLLLAVIYVLFQWYSAANSRRIKEQNLNYAMDSVRQSVVHVRDEFDSALRQIRSDVDYVEIASDQPDVSLALLKGMESDSAFDALRYTNREGITFATNGDTTDSSDRDFYINGIKGESGISVLLESRITGKAILSFYAPVHYNGEIIGVLRGIYSAEKYLQSMLITSYFGRAADVYLCTGDGMVIAASDGSSYDRPLMEVLLDEGVIDAETAEIAGNAIRQGRRECGLICDDDSSTDNLCILDIPDSDYILVQTFPQSVTQSMVSAANHTGIVLQIVLVMLFAVCIFYLWLNARYRRIQLEKENKDMGYITSSVNSLFSHFILVDFENDTYRYLSGAKPMRIDFPATGRYDDFIPYICSFLANEEDVPKVRKHLEKETVIEHLGNSGSSLQYEYLVHYTRTMEWMHCNIICVERKNGKADKVMFLWQNVTGFKEWEQRTKSEVSVVSRRAQRYIEKTLTDAFCIYEVNLTRDWIERVSVSRHDKLVVSQLGKDVAFELEQVGVKTACRASLWFDVWKRFVGEESMEGYCEWASVSYLLDCFSRGETEAVVEYWTDEVRENVFCIRQSCFMSKDDESGDVMGLIVAKEITSQVRQQREQMQALQEALRQAQRANVAKSTFLSNMSHDVRTPMNAIIGYTNIAINHIDNREKVQACLQKVLSSSGHLLNLINDILDMSHIEDGKMQIKEQACSLPELVFDLLDILQPQIKAKHIELTANTFHVVNEDIIADPLKLCQIFVNLLGNAVKYTPAGGKITFDIFQKTAFGQDFGDYTFVVRDNGIGMSPEFMEHIFEPFERETSVTKNGIKGAGLGMTITKHIVDMMGGTIDVRSKKGEGSEFRVELRLKLPVVEPDASQVGELDGLRVMVVDEDFDSCDSVCRLLRQLGMSAEWVSTGKEAVMRAENACHEGDPYRMYIIDWRMAEKNGVETIEKIRDIVGKDIPVMILTAYDRTDIEERAKDAGVTDFCAKPLFLSRLKSALLAAIHQKEENDCSRTKIDFKGKRVLLVDDNEMNREIAETVLLEAGFVVESASDGTDAVDMIQRADEYYYDAVLTDIQMPVMDGYEEAKAIRAMSRKDVQSLPIIAISSNGMQEDKNMALTSGINDWLDKPLYVEAFMEVLTKHLG